MTNCLGGFVFSASSRHPEWLSIALLRWKRTIHLHQKLDWILLCVFGVIPGISTVDSSAFGIFFFKLYTVILCTQTMKKIVSEKQTRIQ